MSIRVVLVNCKGRRFRSLKMWFVMRLYGVTGLQQHIRKQVPGKQSWALSVFFNFFNNKK